MSESWKWKRLTGESLVVFANGPGDWGFNTNLTFTLYHHGVLHVGAEEKKNKKKHSCLL